MRSRPARPASRSPCSAWPFPTCRYLKQRQSFLRSRVHFIAKESKRGLCLGCWRVRLGRTFWGPKFRRSRYSTACQLAGAKMREPCEATQSSPDFLLQCRHAQEAGLSPKVVYRNLAVPQVGLSRLRVGFGKRSVRRCGFRCCSTGAMHRSFTKWP